MRVVDAAIEKCHDHALAAQSVLSECLIVLCRLIDGAVAGSKLDQRESQSEAQKNAKSFHSGISFLVQKRHSLYTHPAVRRQCETIFSYGPPPTVGDRNPHCRNCP